MTERMLHTAAAPFESARRVGILPAGHRSQRLHGHSFLARVRAELPEGWAPFRGGETDALSEQLIQCVSKLDYDLLNNHIEIPTDENLARWIWSRLLPGLPELSKVVVQETCNAGCIYTGV